MACKHCHDEELEEEEKRHGAEQEHHGHHHHDDCCCHDDDDDDDGCCDDDEEEGDPKVKLIRIIIAAVLLVVMHFVPLDWRMELCIAIAAYLVVGYDVAKEALEKIFHGKALDEDFLMFVATVGAFALGIMKRGGFSEAVAVMLFFQVGELFEDFAVDKSRESITDLMDIRPDYANVVEDGNEVKKDPADVEVGSLIVVKPGEKVPIDGVVEDGKSTLDTAALTGESMPRDIQKGDEVISGCINQSGVLKVRTTKAFGESTASKILDLVSSAQSRKSRSEKFITKFARVYTPIVVAAAVAVAVLPPVIRCAMGMEADFLTFLYRALSFLVVSCPCALVISIPLSFFAGLGGASRAGILVKGSNFLEMMSKTKTVAFDKTGTLTKGVFEVSAFHHCSREQKELLYYAAAAESASSHPIAVSLRKAYGESLENAVIEDIQEISGNGITATIDGHRVACGNEKLMERLSVSPIVCDNDYGTVIHVAIDGKYEGHVVISDDLKPTSKEALSSLQAAGVKTVMLTGDTEKAAERIAKEAGVTDFKASLLPQDKVAAVEDLLAEQKSSGGTVAFVGDGINDAPVLARADIGIAMGAMGSDAAIEAADIVIMDDDPRGVARARSIARHSLTIVYENIVFAIGVKLLCLILIGFGLAGMWLGVFADVGVMVLCVLNAMRALLVKKAHQ